jgi:hypothetical protein
MISFHTHCQANIALLTMEKVFSKSFSNSANATVLTVEDRFVGIVVPEFAVGAVVFGHDGVAVCAFLANGLYFLTNHAHHCFRFMTTIPSI